MGKRKKFNKEKVLSKKDVNTQEMDNTLDPSSRNFIFDEVDEYNDRDDYDDQYSDSHMQVIRDNDSQEQVLGIGGLSSDDEDGMDQSSASDNDDELFEDGLESRRTKHILDERMMGKKKQDYFGTDIPDEKIHNETRQHSKGEPLSLIEEGARKLQERMSAQLQGLSYSYLLPQEEKIETKSNIKEDIECAVSVSKLSDKKALKLMKKTSPEFLSIVEELKERCGELKTVLSPLIKAKKKGLLPSSPCVEYLQTRYLLGLNYITIVPTYMAIRSSESYSTDHPIVLRIAQYEYLYKELDTCKDKFDPELMSLLEDLKSGKLKSSTGRKMLGVVSEICEKRKGSKDRLNDSFSSDSEENEIDSDNIESDQENSLPGDASDSLSSDEDEGQQKSKITSKNNPKTLSIEDRRALSYTIIKNKGLMPSRKKEQRNPRVKYKNKYQKKLKRRKGQVREVRKEIQKYSGEISGIKANLVKSRKLK